MRARIACDGCGRSAWIGARPGDSALHDAWCEACQLGASVPPAEAAGEPTCERCGGPLTLESPRFVELWGELQNLQAVLAAWGGRPDGLRALLPDRPRFLSDLTPPAPDAADSTFAREALAALAAGDYTGALARLSSLPQQDTRLAAARAIATQRTGHRTQAIETWGAVLALGEAPRARLVRGALLADEGRWAEAEADLARAGHGVEARWNRASLRVHRAVEGPGAAPDRGEIEKARAEAGPPSSYWSDPTVGRLLWTLLLERGLARRAIEPSAAADERAMRAAELQLEFDTFWDRALILYGYAALGWTRDAARVAAPLARERLDAIEAEPPVRGAALKSVRAALAAARLALASGDPTRAQLAIATLLERDDLRRYRIPCAHCELGTVGVDEMVESLGDAEGG